jgi:hypothetical protein
MRVFAAYPRPTAEVDELLEDAIINLMGKAVTGTLRCQSPLGTSAHTTNEQIADVAMLVVTAGVGEADVLPRVDDLDAGMF